MKKKLVVLLAVVMMFAFAASAYAVDFTDLDDQSVTVQDAVAKTTALGIIEGYEDGTFGPTQNITRAEFAKIAVTAAGAKETASMLEGNASSFKDVKAGQWYTGWINASESLGIFQGDGNGNFRPNDSISNQEVITVLLRLLGYNDNLTGTWPVNYVTQANKEEILDDVTIVASAAATRADVVVMLDATLDADIVTYDKDTNEFVKKQTTISGSSYITLLEDSFKGSYVEVDTFPAVNQVRDAAKEQLNWTVGSTTMIIDKDTKVSYNGGSLFDLEDHQGKVYFVKDSDKYYARFIEVESYTKLVSDKPAMDGTKVKSGSTSYNAVSKVYFSDNAGGKNGEYDSSVTASKNSKYVMYFNDDDQVYLVKSDMDYTEKSYYVKSVSTSSVKLVAGTKSTTVSMKDGDTLIWTGDEFIAPSELQAGDAVMEITNGDLYVLIDEKSGELTKITQGSQSKANIGGTNYVYAQSNTAMKDFLDDEFEDAGIDDDEVLGNEVKFILNKDNSIAAVIVDETSIGTTLYGIVIDIGGNSNSLANKTDNITIFTSEGKSVTYDFDLDTGYTVPDHTAMAGLVAYELNKDGEIDEITLVDGTGSDQGSLLNAKDGTEEVEVVNNAYLRGNGNTVTLASTAVIFEVSEDDGDVDPSVVTRSSVLAGGDFTPTSLTSIKGAGGTSGVGAAVSAYAVYVLNSNGAAKALAYTDADTSNYHYGVIDSYNFRNADNNNNITFDNDDYIYELDETNSAAAGAKGDYLAIYTLSGDKVKVVYAYPNDDGMKDKTSEVTGWNDGLMTFAAAVTVDETKNASNTSKTYAEIMTDSDTVVYVIDASTGDYVLGELGDIAKAAHVYVPVVDKDDVADIVIVDDYTNYTKVAAENAATPAPTVTGTTAVTWTDNEFATTVDTSTYTGISDAAGLKTALGITITATDSTTITEAYAEDTTNANKTLTITVTSKDTTKTATYKIVVTEATGA